MPSAALIAVVTSKRGALSVRPSTFYAQPRCLPERHNRRHDQHRPLDSIADPPRPLAECLSSTTRILWTTKRCVGPSLSTWPGSIPFEHLAAARAPGLCPVLTRLRPPFRAQDETVEEKPADDGKKCVPAASEQMTHKRMRHT